MQLRLDSLLIVPCGVPGVELLVSPNQNFYGYYNPGELSTLSLSLDQLDEYISAEGPFDAVMGFSSGAVLAAMYMIVKQRRNGVPPFRCAILLSSASSTAEKKYLEVDESKDMICIPTAHIWGSEDEVAPTGGADLSQLCDPAKRHELIHNARHEIPRNRFETEIAQAVRRVVYEAGRDYE